MLDDVQQGIKELVIVTPIMHDIHNNESNMILFKHMNVIPIDKNKYESKYDVVLDSLRNKGFEIMIA